MVKECEMDYKKVYKKIEKNYRKCIFTNMKIGYNIETEYEIDYIKRSSYGRNNKEETDKK